MLIINRRYGETVTIGDVSIRVKKLTPSRVSLAIEAPPGTSIRRGELGPLPPAQRYGDGTAQETEES